MTFIFYNPLSNNKKGKQDLVKITELLKIKEASFFDVTKNKDIRNQILALSAEDTAVISGGDGTLHRFANTLYENNSELPEIKANLFYYPSGSGNDFMNDIADSKEKKLINLKPYLKNLPTVTINGKTSHFLNGIGVGLDGWCCTEAQKILQKKSNKSINYSLLALKGVLYAYKPASMTAIVDGIPHRYNNTWIAPTMNGKFFGGGMKIAPEQDRLNSDHMVSFVVVHTLNRFRALPIFPEFVSGKYIRHTKYATIIPAKEITVTFDKPISLEIDGEPFSNISSYSVKTAKN